MAPALEGLTSLEHLSLGFNELGGELSCGLLGPEKKLHELDLAHNEIEGSIPECLLSSSALQELYLANNALSGSLPTMFEDVPLTTLSVADQASIMPAYSHPLVPCVIPRSLKAGSQPVMKASAFCNHHPAQP